MRRTNLTGVARACFQLTGLVAAGVLLFAAEVTAADYGVRMSGNRSLLVSAVDAGSVATTGTRSSQAAADAAATAGAASPAAPAATPAPTPTSTPNGMTRLPGHVLPAIAGATPRDTAPSEQRQRLTLTVTLKRDDPAGFERYLRDLYDPQSAHFRRFLTPTQVANRFGPSKLAYRQVERALLRDGFKTVQRSKNRLTLSVQGRRDAAERAFALTIRDYQSGGTSFYANDADPALPLAAAAHVEAIAGLANLARPASSKARNDNLANYFPNNPAGQALWYGLCMNEAISGGSSAITGSLAFFFPVILPEITIIALFLFLVPTPLPPPFGNTTAFSLFPQYFKCANQYNKAKNLSLIPGYDPPAPAWQGVDGTGQTVGLVEFDTYDPSDITDYASYMGLATTAASNVTPVHVNGGASAGSNQDEVLLDITDVMTAAPGAKIQVYDSPFTGPGTSFQSVFNAMINGGVTIISNSWAYCEDQTTLADVQSIDAVLQTAAASGVTVLSGSGDLGSSCLDGSANTVAVPADSPHITAVGGTTMTSGPGFTYGSETWWDGSSATVPTGQGGFGVSKFFARPDYQSAATTSAMRSVPDVAVEADPATGNLICQASQGGCPSGYLYGGTSSSAPSMAAYVALLNQAQGSKLGFLNSLIYPLANTDAFHNAASMHTDFAHVGLGSPNLARLHQALTHQTAGAVSTSVSMASAFLPNSYTFPHNQAQGLPLPDPADGTSPAYIVVNLADANGNTLSGKTISVTAGSGSHAVITPQAAVTSADGGAATFMVTDLTAEVVTFTATDTTDSVVMAQTPQVAFVVPIASAAGINGNPSQVAADGQTAATVTVTMKDALGRPTPGKIVSLTAAGAHAVVAGPTPSWTDVNGQIQFSVTDQVSETVTLSAVDVTDGNLPVPGSATITYSGSTSTACGVGVAPTAAPGYTITPFMTGFPASANLYYNNVNFGCPGANPPAFTSAGNVLVSDFLTGSIYQGGLAGGTVTSTNIISNLGPALSGLVYGKDGSLYATSGANGGEIIQVDPVSGAALRVVAPGLTCPGGLVVDPLSGDLFFDDQCTGAGDDNASIWRIIDPANTDANHPTSVVVYATLPATPNGGMAFAPNGTLYAVSGYYYSDTAQVEQISATSAATVTVTPVTGITSDYAVAIGVTNTDGSAQSLIVEPAGTLSEVPVAAPSNAVILGTGSPGVGVTGPDGCLYSAHYDTIYRLANASGGCNFAPTSPAPAIKLSPVSVTPNPSQGTTQTFTATVSNVATLSGIPVFFRIDGANKRIQLAHTDANGNAVVTYTSVSAGTDTVMAAATVNSGTILQSNVAHVTWAAGQHATILSMNTSARGATGGAAVTVSASLTDLSATPIAGIAGQTVTFTLGSATCTALTASNGTASCQLTAPATAGTEELTANFAGTSQFAAAEQGFGFQVSVPPAPAPTVKISVSPVTIAAGSAATLTWSSTNATACTASGAWSGTQATNGTQSVTPTTAGSFSYTLSCSGTGGTTAATAVLSATLIAVTVTGKSGGGAMSGLLMLMLGLLVLLRVSGLCGASLPRFARRGSVQLLIVGFVASGAMHSAHADDSASSAAASSWLDPFYIGIRAGAMPERVNSGNITKGLAALGFDGVTARADGSGAGGTAYVGYDFTPSTAVEVGYTYRKSTVATLTGTIPSAASLAPLLADTTELLRGFGSIYSLSYRGRFEVAPRFTLNPRLGAFFWDTDVTASGGGESLDVSRQGGGVTAGVSANYRVWRGLEFGLNVDFYRGFPNNIATLYGGTLEWHFGRGAGW